MPRPTVSLAALANATAWLAIAALIGVAAVVADRFGFLGLLLLGALTWLVCIRAALDNEVPTGGIEVLTAALARPRSPEDRASLEAERGATLSPFRFYGRCGAFLAVVGAAGFAWQVWRG